MLSFINNRLWISCEQYIEKSRIPKYVPGRHGLFLFGCNSKGYDNENFIQEIQLGVHRRYMRVGDGSNGPEWNKITKVLNGLVLFDITRDDLHGTTLSDATRLRHAYNTNCFV